MTDVSTRHPVVGRAQELVPLIKAHVPYSEENRALHPEVVDGCAEAGLFRLLAPNEVGGQEAPLPDASAAVEIIASADPAVAWYLTNSSPVGMLGARMTRELQEKVFASDRNFGYSAAPGSATKVDGGYLLSGIWPLMTGVSNADWAVVLARVVSPDALSGQIRMFVFPTSSVEIDPIWDNAAAMRGTGSHRVSASEVFVEDGLSFLSSDPSPIDRPLFRLGLALAPMSLNGAVVVGALRSAVDSAAAIVGSRVSTITGSAATDNVALLELLSAARNALWTLRAGCDLAWRQAWECAERNEEVPTDVRAAILSGPFYSVAVARDLVSRLYARSSSATFFNGHPLEKSLRDIHAISYGFEPLRILDHDAGRVAAGVPPLDASRWGNSLEKGSPL